ncbi:hypothetical protein [Arthrobacter castelli]|uniref:hypothetical protein n=1 Tax=Arthrobacter castelli TaxID=271431 RepID=UPI00047E1A7D|nr:hypothetical protein [Arthrobacter castelli]
MATLSAIVIINAAIGFAIWGIDRKRATYGLLLPAGIAVATGLLLWVILVAFSVSYTPGISWLAWLLPMIAGMLAAIATVVVLARRRAASDDARYTETLQAR